MSKASSMAGYSMTLSNLAAEAEGEEEELEVEGAVQEEVVAPANRSYRVHAPMGNREKMNIPVMRDPTSL